MLKSVIFLIVLCGCISETTPLSHKGPIAPYRGRIQKCELHNCDMLLDTVPIWYGMLRLCFSDSSYSIGPHASLHIPGGCCVEKADWGQNYYCAQCRRELKQYWLRAKFTNECSLDRQKFELEQLTHLGY